MKKAITLCIILILLFSTQAQAGQRSEFFSFMSYRAITYRNSRQWQMQQSAWTDFDGLRRYNSLIMVAIGTGHGHFVGDEIYITLSSGMSFPAIVGDIKCDRHTDPTNRFTAHNNCWLEFIVCIPSICPIARNRGDISFKGFYGYVVSIEAHNIYFCHGYMLCLPWCEYCGNYSVPYYWLLH